MGDDEQFEYIYRYVSARPWRAMRREGINPLDRGTLYACCSLACTARSPIFREQGFLHLRWRQLTRRLRLGR